MSLFRRGRRASSLLFEPPISPIYQGTNPLATGRGATPSIEQALQSDAVWACVRLLSDTVSMLPLQAYTMRGDVRVPLAPQPPLLRSPSADAEMPDWLWQIMSSLLLRGNAYGLVAARDSMEYPTQVEILHPDAVQPRQDSETRRWAYWQGATMIPRENILHIRAYRMGGSFVGMSPIAYAAANAIRTDHATNDFSIGFFQDGAHPTSVYTSEQPINQDQARTIKERVLASVRGREPLILGAGLSRAQVQVSPEESQFLATQKWSVARIARVFGVPPEMIAAEAGNSMTYANVEQRSLDYLTFSTQSWLTRIEAAVSPLLAGAKHVRFDTSALLRTDFETQMKASAIGIASKQMTPDEARAARDMPPLTQEQKDLLELVPLTVSPTGLPRAHAAPAANFTAGDNNEGGAAA